MQAGSAGLSCLTTGQEEQEQETLRLMVSDYK